MGGAGHFGMGNTNTLATVDVAGAYIVRKFLVNHYLFEYIFTQPEVSMWLMQGLSQHSIFFTGMLAFIITYAVPLLYMMGILSLMMLMMKITHQGSIGFWKHLFFLLMSY